MVSTESEDRFTTLRLEDESGEISFIWSETRLGDLGLNRWFLRLVATEDEYVWGGGEQYSFFNLRNGGSYPIWTREQGVGRNKSSDLTQVCHHID